MPAGCDEKKSPKVVRFATGKTLDEVLIVSSVLEHELCSYQEPSTEAALSSILDRLVPSIQDVESLCEIQEDENAEGLER